MLYYQIGFLMYVNFVQLMCLYICYTYVYIKWTEEPSKFFFNGSVCEYQEGENGADRLPEFKSVIW